MSDATSLRVKQRIKPKTVSNISPVKSKPPNIVKSHLVCIAKMVSDTTTTVVTPSAIITWKNIFLVIYSVANQ